jgi:hypothetical protein
MNEHRREVLDMLASGKINADEAERLIAALEGPGAEAPPSQPAKYLRVLVESEDGRPDGPSTVRIRVPLQLLRSGVKLASLIPHNVHSHVNAALHDNGIRFDLSQIKPENLEELIDQLNDVTLHVDDKKHKVKIRFSQE